MLSGNAPVRQPVGALVPRVPGVAPDPVPLDLVLARELVEAAPEVDVLHGLAIRGGPALALPGVDPFRDALLHVLRVGVETHAARPLQRLQRADDGGELHAVVGGRGLAAPELLLDTLRPQQRAPAARTG